MLQCFLYLVSSINASIFHITWLYNFWTDLIYRKWILLTEKYKYNNIITVEYKIMDAFFFLFYSNFI